MARSHAEAVRAMAPSAASRVIPIDPDGDVEDPIGGALSLYRDVAGRFSDAARRPVWRISVQASPARRRARRAAGRKPRQDGGGLDVKIVIGSDHRGFDKKRWLAPKLRELGHEVIDIGCESSAACDYPDFAAPAARQVARGEADLCILLDNSGIGMSIVANKIRGIRAALALDLVAARLAREANHCNVLCIATELLSDAMIEKIAREFVTTSFTSGRHDRRVKKISAIESEECTPATATKAVATALTTDPAPTDLDPAGKL